MVKRGNGWNGVNKNLHTLNFTLYPAVISEKWRELRYLGWKICFLWLFSNFYPKMSKLKQTVILKLIWVQLSYLLWYLIHAHFISEGRNIASLHLDVKFEGKCIFSVILANFDPTKLFLHDKFLENLEICHKKYISV